MGNQILLLTPPLWFLLIVFLLIAALISGFFVGWYLGRRRAQRVLTRTDIRIGNSRVANDASDLSAHLLNATLTEMREGLLVIDRDMRVLTANRAAQQLVFNLGDDGIASRRLTELTRNPAIYDAFLDGVRGTERSGVKVETYRPERRVFDLRVVPLQSANGKASHGAVGVFFDITRLERLELIRQEFLSNVSHELRTPLTSIIALAETLETGAIDNPEHNRRFLTIIQKNAARMHRLIDDILELSAIEAGNVKVKQEVVQLHPLVEEVVGSLSAAASTQAITQQNLVPKDATVF